MNKKVGITALMSAFGRAFHAENEEHAVSRISNILSGVFCGLDITGCICGFIGNEYEFLSWVLNIKDASLLK